MLQVNGVGRHQPNVPVDPRARVPAGCRLAGVVGPHRQNVGVLLTESQEAGHLILKADVSVRPLPQRDAIEPHCAVGHHAIELDEHPPMGILYWQREVFAVPAHAGRQESPGAARRAFLVERPFDTPVMGHVEGAPGGILEGRLLRAGGVRLEKSPVAIERYGGSDWRIWGSLSGSHDQ